MDNIMKLVIVESPHKCETIAKYLGKGYKVIASVGHINDLATTGKGGFGVDIENDFKAKYVINKAKIGVANELKYQASKAEEVILATDPDREGEAIAWHLANILELDISKTKRLKFHEITAESIQEAIENPTTIDMNLVESQEARRIIDRIIGFKLSGLLQRKMHYRSAGRVQSATLKLITDHDKEIEEFVPEEYWSLSLDLSNGKTKLTANYLHDDENKKIANEKENKAILAKLKDKAEVVSITPSSRVVESKPAFTTSTMVQEAISTLHMSAESATRTAQMLYEGVNSDNIGLVTYIRTDSVALSDTFTHQAKAYIQQKFGKEFVGHRKSAKVNAAQNAHEAIRPTSIYRTPESLKNKIPSDQYRLYKLIYNRALASLMTAKVEDVLTVIFKCGEVSFKCEGTRLRFPGYSLMYKDGDEYKKSSFPKIEVGDIYNVDKINNEQEYTKAPAHYTEAKIIKLMEEKGIGRPSTYASTIKTLKSSTRQYIKSEKGSVISTEAGNRVSYVLNKYFPELIDTKYTADMEKDLDKIQDGKVDRTKILKEFYKHFIKLYDEVAAIMYSDHAEILDEKCPVCGANLVRKKSKFGEFVGCSNFPKCHYIESTKEVEYTGQNCPKCGRPLIYRLNKANKKFIGCSGYPDCDYMEPIKRTRKPKEVLGVCPDCGGDLVLRTSKGRKFVGCSNFPKCNHQEEYNIHKYHKK